MPDHNIKIRAIRRRLGLTQKELATELGISANTIARWERGERVPAAFSLTVLKGLEQRYHPPERLNSEGLGWNKIDNDKILQRLVNQLVALELNSPGFIPSSPYIGADGGWDGYYKGTYLERKGIWSFQSKFRKRDLKEAYASLRQELLGKGQRAGEIEKAAKEKVDYLVIATNAELSVPYIRQLQSLKKKPIKEIFVWDREYLSQRIHLQPWLKHHFFGNPQHPMLVPASEYFPNTEPDLLSSTIGRNSQIRSLCDEIVAKECNITIIHSPGGFGKSHILRELSKIPNVTNTSWQPWYIRAGFRDPKEAIQDEIIRDRKYILLLDDAERIRELDAFVSYVKSFNKNCRLVISTRTAGLDIIIETLRRHRLDPGQQFEIPELSQEEQIQLLLEAAGHEPVSYPDRIVKFLGGVPYLIATAGRQIAKGLPIISQNGLEKQLVSDFIYQCEMVLSDILPRDKTRDLIANLSLIAPMSKRDNRLLETLASHLGVDMSLLTKVLNRMEERKLLRVIGNAFRFRPDMLGDLCLSARLLEKDEDVFSKVVLEIWLESKPETVLTNLAAAARGSRHKTVQRILNDLIVGWISEASQTPIYNRQTRLKHLQPAVYLAPNRTLDLINTYVKSPAPVTMEGECKPHPLNMDDYGPLLLNVGYIPGYQVQTAETAISLYRLGLGGTYGNYKLPRLIASLVDPFSHSLEDINRTVDHLYSQCINNPHDEKYAEAFIACSSELLAGSHEHTDSYEDTISIGNRCLPTIQPVLEFRRFCLERYLKLISHPNKRTRCLAIEALEHHGFIHPNISRDIPLKENIFLEKQIILTTLEEVVATETELEVLSALDTLLIKWWITNVGGEATTRLLEKFEKHRTITYSTYRFFVSPQYAIVNFSTWRAGAPDVNRWNWWIERHTWEPSLEYLKLLAKDILVSFSDFEQLIKLFQHIDALVGGPPLMADFPIIEAIHALQPQLCSNIRRTAILWDAMPDRFKTPIDCILSREIPGHVDSLIQELFTGNVPFPLDKIAWILPSIAASTSSTMDEKSSWLRSIVIKADSAGVRQVLSRCSWILDNGARYIVPILLEALPRMDNGSFREVAFAINRIKNDIPDDAPVIELKERIILKLGDKPDLDDYDVDLLEFAFDANVSGFFNWIKKRLLKDSDDTILGNFRAIPFHGFPFLEKLIRNERDLEELLDLSYEAERADHSLRFSLDHLLKPVCTKIINENRTYIILSCDKLMNDNSYMSIHPKLLWRLRRISLDDHSRPIFVRALKLAETNCLLDELANVIWNVVTPHHWHGSIGEIPQQFIDALKAAQNLKAELPAGPARVKIEEIEQSIFLDIERIKLEHETYLHSR